MKNMSLLFLFTILPALAFAQDIIIKLSGQEISAKVTEITLTDILFIYPDSLPDIYQSIPKSEVFMIKYANGTKEVFTENLPENQFQTASAYSPEEMYNLGRRDARTYHRANGALWGSAASSLVLLYGLAGPIIIGAVPPDINPNDIPNQNFTKDENYMRGYKKQAHNKKIGNAAAGAAIGTATIFTVAIVLLTAAWAY
jgi:hypothetical protein